MTMINKLTQFEFKAHVKQIGFWVAALVMVWMAFMITGQRGSNLLFANSSYAITQTFIFMVPNIIFVVCVLASSTLLRDSQYKMESLIFTTPIDKFQYLTSRYLGLVFATLFLILIAMLVMMLTLLKLDAALVGPFHLSYYLTSFCIFIVPAVLLCCSVVFAAAMFSKSMIAVYVSGIAVYVIYIIGSVFGNSPMLVGSSTLLNDSAGFSSLLEPYGLIAYMQQSAYWTSEQRNTLMPMLTGDLLLNRILWLAISISLFVFTYHKFAFRQSATVKKTEKKQQESASKIDVEAYNAIDITHDFQTFNFNIWLSKLKLEYASLTKGLTFIVLLVITVVFTAALLIGNIFSGPISNGQSYFPLTELILEVLQQPLSDIGMLVAIFYAVELFWNERVLNMNAIVDATPTRNFTFYLAKLTTVLAVGFTLITASIIVAMIFQLTQQHYDIQPLLYLSLYYYAGVPIVLTALLTLFLQRFAVTKSVGLLLGFGIFVANIVIKAVLFTHPLISFAYRPQFIYSDMAQTLYHSDALHWYNLYWLSLAIMLSVLTIKFWQRGLSNVSQKLTRGALAVLVLSGTSMIASGGYIYYQTNVFNEFLTKEQAWDKAENYEQQYAQYKGMPTPTVTDVNVDVNIYPGKRSYDAKGIYNFENKTNKVIEQLLLSVVSSGHVEQDITVEDATLINYDEANKQYVFQLNSPMLPHDKRSLIFELNITHNGFVELDGEHYVTQGGAYIELEDVIPRFGFDERLTIGDEDERAKRGLVANQLQVPNEQDSLVSEDWINFETTVSTSSQHKVATVGKLQKSWVDNDRNFFHFKTDQRVNQQLAYVSAQFDVTLKQHNNVAISIYHHSDHDKDNALILNALSNTMDYFDEHFFPYRSDEFTVVELPYFSSNQSFGSAQPGMYLGVENRFFNLDNEGSEQNPLLRGVSHEFAHQYWGGYLEPNYIGGYATLTETLCKYTELVVARKLYGQYAANVEVHLSIDRYLQARPYNDKVENPLYHVGFQPFIYYAKGKQVMHAMLDLIGESNINQALRGLLKSHGYPKKPTSLDLLNAFYSVSTPEQHLIIDDLFKRVVFHEFKVNDVNTVQQANGEYATTVDVSTLKMVLNPETNKEEFTVIDDHIEVGLYSGYPAVDNDNVLTMKKFHFNQDKTTITLYSKEKPGYVQIDPNRYRIDRAMINNVMEIK